MWKRKRRSGVRGALAGIAAGLVASFAMNQFQAGLAKVKNRKEQPAGESPEEPATVKAAESVLRHDLSPGQKKPAGNIVHYVFGAAAGGVYGLVAEKTSVARIGFGTLFGSVLWLLADEIAVPALGLAKGPREYPLSAHGSALASHLVYGAATELVRSGLRAI